MGFGGQDGLDTRMGLRYRFGFQFSTSFLISQIDGLIFVYLPFSLLPPRKASTVILDTDGRGFESIGSCLLEGVSADVSMQIANLETCSNCQPVSFDDGNNNGHGG